MNFTRKHDYLVCLDSDGTVMDSMTIKHVRCFGPCFVDVFNIDEHRQEILDEWNRINLYSLTRGINRFQGLMAIIEFVNKKYNIYFDDQELFFTFVTTSDELSNAKLALQSELTPSKTISLALEWSNKVNESIKKLPKFHSFKYVREVLEELSKFADLVGVSSANKDAVVREWKEENLYSYFSYVACQDEGTKEAIIAKALEKGYEKDHSFMIGDAKGDLIASKNNNIYFLPIIPKREESCFKRILENYVDLIKTNRYDEKINKELEDEFLNSLKEGV